MGGMGLLICYQNISHIRVWIISSMKSLRGDVGGA
jgi:hypothetical protein